MIEVYTDGSAVAHGEKRGLGGYSVIFTLNSQIKKIVNEGYYNTKTGRMELRAFLTALQILGKKEKATIYSDSMYVVKSITENWIIKWERTGWPCKNSDLMKLILNEYRKFPKGNVTVKHVKGHNGNEFNEIADEFASYKNFEVYKKDLNFI